MAEALAQQTTLQEVLEVLKRTRDDGWSGGGPEGTTEKIVDAVDKGSDRTAVVAE